MGTHKPESRPIEQLRVYHIWLLRGSNLHFPPSYQSTTDARCTRSSIFRVLSAHQCTPPPRDDSAVQLLQEKYCETRRENSTLLCHIFHSISCALFMLLSEIYFVPIKSASHSHEYHPPKKQQ